MFVGSWLSASRVLSLHMPSSCWCPTRPNGLIVTLPPATTVKPSWKASLMSLLVGVPLGSSRSADISTLRRQQEVDVEHDALLAEVVAQPEPATGEAGSRPEVAAPGGRHV